MRETVTSPDDDTLRPPLDLRQCLFIVWHDALGLVDKIRADLTSEFAVLADVRIHWSDALSSQNMDRLYRQALTYDSHEKPKSEKITKPEFHLFYVETNSVDEALHASATGEIERIHRTFAEKKAEYRNWSLNAGNAFPYLIHCAAQIDELRLQTALLLGPDAARALWRGERYESDCLKQDVAGAAGWRSLGDAFYMLDTCIDWCVLRGWEGLPETFTANDLDILVADNRRAASALGLRFSDQQRTTLRSGKLNLVDEEISVDLHWVGDGYLDAVWERAILDRRIRPDGVFRPNSEHAFFSMIYSEYVNRPKERESKVQRIRRIGDEIAHTGWINEALFSDRQSVLKMLSGYMKVSGYVWTPPVVERYRQPKDAVSMLPGAHNSLGSRKWWSPIAIAKRVARLIIPARLRRKLSGPIKSVYRRARRWI